MATPAVSKGSSSSRQRAGEAMLMSVLRALAEGRWAFERDERDDEWFSAGDLEEATGRDAKTLRPCLDAIGRVVEEGGPGNVSEHRRGRRSPRYWRLRDDAGYVCAVEFGHTTFGVAFGSLAGNAVALQRSREGYDPRSPKEVFERSAVACNQMRERSGIPAGSVFAVVASVAASIRYGPFPETDDHYLVARDSWLPGWTGLTPAHELRRRLRLRKSDCNAVAVNDANLAALGEAWWGAGVGKKSLIFVEWSDGIGAGIVLNGAIHLGAHSAAGEFGHARILRLKPPPDHRCSCDHEDCLEATASTSAISLRVHSRPDAFGAVWQAAEDGSPEATKAIAQSAAAVGIAVAQIVAAIDPEVLVLGGEAALRAGDRPDLLLEPFRNTLEQHLPPGFTTPDVAISKLGEKAPLRGALTHGLDRFLASHLTAVVGAQPTNGAAARTRSPAAA